MKYAYAAVFYPEETGGYSVIFPDLNDLATQGDDLVEAMSMAEEACSLYLFTTLKDGEALPQPTPVTKIEKDEEDAFANLILVDIERYAKKYSDKSVKKTLSIPGWLNLACEARKINFSGVLQEALIQRLSSSDPNRE